MSTIYIRKLSLEMYFKNTFKRNGRFTNLYFVGTLDCTKGKKYKNFETLTVSWCTKNTKEREREREREGGNISTTQKI